MSRNMMLRVAVAAVGIPAALGVVYVGGWLLAALVAVFGVVGAHELYRLAARSGARPLATPGYLAAGGIPLATFAAYPQGGGLPASAIILGGVPWLMLVMAAALGRRAPTDRPLAAVSITVFGALYAGGLPAFLVVLRHGGTDFSAWAATGLVFLPLVLTWVGDSLAMAGGSMIGGARLAPVLSPNKTWAGAVSGGVSAVLLAPVYGAVVLAPLGVRVAAWQLALFGLVVSIVGQAGDVAESLFKREAGVKDSGTFFPGHGGVLDRLDSLYWAIPVAVLLLALFEVL